MNLPEWFKPAAWGTVFGLVALTMVATVTGWKSYDTAEEMAKTRSDKAILATKTTICVAQFKIGGQAGLKAAGSDSADSQGLRLAALKKEDAWKRAAFISKKGWATMPGNKAPNAGVAKACSDELMKLTKASN